MHKLTKISLHEDREMDSRFVPVGCCFESFPGDVFEPVVEQCYYIGGRSGLRTSPVREVKDISPGKKLLKTLNSYYLLEEIDEKANNE